VLGTGGLFDATPVRFLSSEAFKQESITCD